MFSSEPRSASTFAIPLRLSLRQTQTSPRNLRCRRWRPRSGRKEGDVCVALCFSLRWGSGGASWVDVVLALVVLGAIERADAVEVRVVVSRVSLQTTQEGGWRPSAKARRGKGPWTQKVPLACPSAHGEASPPGRVGRPPPAGEVKPESPPMRLTQRLRSERPRSGPSVPRFPPPTLP